MSPLTMKVMEYAMKCSISLDEYVVILR